MSFADRLAEILADRGMNKSDLARKMHPRVTSQAVGQWGAPGKTMPTGKRLEAIAGALGVTVAELMSDVGTPFRGKGGAALPVEPPKPFRLVDKPDQLRLLDFWDSLEAADERARVFRILIAAVSSLDKTA